MTQPLAAPVDTAKTESEIYFDQHHGEFCASDFMECGHLTGLLRSREPYIAKFGFAVLTRSAIERLRTYGPFVEVGCGSGYWAYELQRAGIECRATDPGTGKYRYLEVGWKPWTSIEKLTGTEAVRKYPAHTLLMVWPDYDEPWAADSLDAFQGDVVVYVGEGEGGCTADDRFHRSIQEHFELIEEIPIPQFYGVHDGLFVWKRIQTASG